MVSPSASLSSEGPVVAPSRRPVDVQLGEAGITSILAGFPKCGTTSLANWLGGSQNLDVSNPKETHLLCPEFDRVSELVDDGLDACFFGDSVKHRMEASTWNVYSESLLEELVARPSIKVILIFRDAADAVVSWHNQMRQAGDAVDDSLTAAWEHALELESGHRFESLDGLQRRRNYARMFMFGHFLNRWIDRIGHQRLLILEMSELNEEGTDLRDRLNRFLDCDLGLQDRPPMLNRFATIRYQKLFRTIKNSFVNRWLRKLESRFEAASRFRTLIKEGVFRRQSKKNSDPAWYDRLRQYFAEDRQIAKSLREENSRFWSVG